MHHRGREYEPEMDPEEYIEEEFQEYLDSADVDDSQFEEQFANMRTDTFSRAQASEDTWKTMINNLENVEAMYENQYQFSANNPYLADLEAAEYESDHFFNLGMKFFEEGNIVSAMHAFEAEIKSNAEHSEAWRMLGTCFAEQDQDKHAIVCLKTSIESDPYNLDTLLALGISFVNELDSAKALQTLKSWVSHNPNFQGISVAVDEFSDGSLMDEVMQLMLEVQRLAPRDLDVKIILGVLYNVSQDYDAAVQLFNEVLEFKPNDYSLYNKVSFYD